MRKILSLTLAFLLCLSMVAVAPIVLADNEYTAIDLTNAVYTDKSDKFLNQYWGSIATDGGRTYIKPANHLYVLSENGHLASFRLAKADGTAFTVEAGETYELVCDFFTNSQWGQGRLIFDVIGSNETVYNSAADETIKYGVPDNGSGKWYDGQVFRFTAPKSGDLRIITIANSATCTNQYMGFSNIKIRKAPAITDMTVDPDFSNYTNNFHFYATNYAGYFSVGTDETTGYKYICPDSHLYATDKQYNSFRPANSEGTAYRVTAGKAYKVVCDLYTNCTSDQGTVYFDAVSANTKIFDSALDQTNAFGIDAVSEATWIEDKEFVFVAQATGDLRITAAARNTTCKDQCIKFANISISETEIEYVPASMDVDFSYPGYTHATQGEKTWYKNTWGWATNPATIEATGTDSLWMRPSNNRLHNINSDTCMKGQWGPCLPNAGFRLVNSKGEAFKLEEGKKYRIKYDLYADFGNVTTEGFGVGIDAIPADKDPSSVPITEIAASNWHAQPTEPRLYDDVSFEFTAKTSGDARVYPFLYGWSELYMNIYFANISITELVEVNIAVAGDAVTGVTVPATAYHNDTFEKLLPKIDHVEWYLDEEYTVPATGAIGVKDVTVYAKVLPYIGIETPGKAGLFIGGKDLSTNAGIDEGVSDNSAVYEIDGEKYTAFRVFGSYVCPDASGTPKTDEIIVGEGVSEIITSRHVILGYGDKEFSIDDCYAKTNANGTALANYWNATQNLDGSWTVTFSLLLKNIPEEYKNTEFKVKSAVVTESEEVIYSDQIVEGVSAQAIYDGIPGEKPVWFN